MKSKKDRFISVKEWNAALQQSEPEKAVFSYFEKFYGKSKQLGKAIDNFQSTNNQSLVLCCLETLSIFSKAQKMDYYFYIRQILQSQKFKKMLEYQLEAIEKKYRVPIRRCNTEKEFINYFVNFTEEYIKNFTEDIIEYVQKFYKTVQILQENSGQFDVQEEKLKDFLNFLNEEKELNSQKEQGENQIYLQQQFELYQKQQEQIKQQYEKICGVLEVTDSTEVKKRDFYTYKFSSKVFQQRQRQNYSSNNQITYHQMPVEPSIKELISSEQHQQVYGWKMFDLQQQENINLEQFFNHHFFILREDCYSGLRKAIYSLKQNNFKKIENVVYENAYLYQQVKFEDVEASYSGLRFKISMKLIPQNNKGLYFNHKKILMSGSLIILTTQSFSIVMFAQVINVPFKIGNDRITQMIKFINLSTQQQLESVQTLLSLGEQIYAIENKVFYEAYCHYLQCLKSKIINKFPFEDQIVKKKKDIPFINCSKDSYYLYLSNKPQENKFLHIDISDLLDPSQLKAVQQFLSKGIALIQGPPGTGKTHCSALGVKILLENGFEDDPKKELVYDFDLVSRHFENRRKYGKLTEKPILVVCQTNHALDQFLKHILQFCHESHVVRLGGRCKDSDLENVLFKTYKQSVVIKHDWKEAHKIKKKFQQKAQSILNLNQVVHSSHLEFFYPNLANNIIKQYLDNENLIYQKFSEKSRQSILTFWLKGLQPNERLRNLIIDNEYYGQNQLLSQRNLDQEQNNIISISDLDSVVESSKNLNETSDLEDDFNEIEPDVESDSENETIQLQSQINDNEQIDDILQQDFITQVSQNKNYNLKSDDFQSVFQLINDSKVETWKISLENRSYLKTYMINQIFQADLIDYNLGQQYEQELHKIKTQSNLVDECFLRTKKVIGVTLTGCAKYMDILKRIEFNTLIIEEAGEVLESHLVSILQKHINHLILIGDHQQLKPHLQNYDLEVKYRANVSLFERLIKNGVEYITLGYQRRMKTKFADFIRLIYKEYNDHFSIQALNKIKVKGIEDDLIFFNHSKLEDPDNENSSKSNSFEAQMVAQFSQYLIKLGISASQITILTTYRKQASLIQSKVQKDLRVSTIDDYQGEENDIILLSLVRSNDKYQLGFVAIDNRICVAFSRAKIGFYVFGNFQFIQESIEIYLQQPKQNQKEGTSDLWLKIIQLAKQKNIALNYLPLYCPIHNEKFQVYDIQDWSKYNGGCSKICGQNFSCGHQCKEKCHVSEHKQSQCKEICEKVLDCGHLCKSFCGVQQFKCQVIIERQFPFCNHKIQLKCFQANMSLICDKKCEKLLNCGHQCQGQCYQDCEKVNCCQVPIQLKLNCNHTKEIKCGEQHYIQNLICYEKCKKMFNCKHTIQQQASTCRQTCGTCLNGFDCQCLEICQKQQFCGHQCEKTCQQDCFGCEKICQYSCNCQIQCQKLCYQRCVQCQNNCQISCLHSKCTKQCYEICDRQPCNERCQLILPCGCQCMGLCGEQCPKICLDNSHDTEQAMQDERYYQLECKNQCVYSVTELDYLIRDEKIPMIICKKCKTTIWSSRRYQDIFKKIIDIYNRQKLEKYAKQEVTIEKLIQIREFVKNKLNYLKNNKLQDQDNFLGNIQRKIQKNINLSMKNQKLELNHENIKSILKQLEYYEKSRIIQCLESEDKEFNRQVIVLGKFYLLNEEFQNYYNDKLWDQIENKIQSLFLFYELDQYLKKRVSLIYYQFRKDILISNFMLSKEQLEDLQDQMYQ